jgi:hypothetical protein
MPTGCSSGRQAPRLTFSALCGWRTLQLWLPLGLINRVSRFLIQEMPTSARPAARKVLGAPARTAGSHGSTLGSAIRVPHARMSRGISHAPAATPACMLKVFAPTTPAKMPTARARAPPPTTQDNRCPGRWRAFPPDQVAWIESLRKLRPLNLSVWQFELRNDEDREFLLYVVEHGLSLTSELDSPLTPFKCRNYKSAYLSFAQVQAALEPDILAQRIFRPPRGVTSSYVHSLGAVPKTESTIRVIHNHSRPVGRSLNDAITQSNFSFQSVDDAIRLMSPNCYMAKVDIEAAYRHVPIDPYDWDKTAFCWPTDSLEDLYFDGYLQFGLKNACEFFNRIGRAIIRMMARRGFHVLAVYVDAFTIVCSTEAMAWYVFWALRILLRKLGFTVNMRAHNVLLHVLNFLDVTLDLVAMQARLSSAKLAALSNLISATLARHSITRKELDRLNGKLNWVCRVVYGGRTFLRRLIDAQWSVKRAHHHIRLSSSIRLDLEWWQQFLPQFNGQTDLIPSKPLSLDDVSTDASSSYGYGAFILGGYFSLSFAQAASQFPDAPAPSEPIHVHELYAVLILCQIFSAALRGLHIRLHIDNTIVVAVINKGNAKGTSGPRMMEYVRHIILLAIFSP